MATAQNFFNSTPAPDPRQNPLAAGLAGGLQGLSNYETQQNEQQAAQQQAQMNMIMEMAKQGKFNLGQGQAGATPMSYAGMQGNYDPAGMTPSGQADTAKAQLYQTMNQDKQGEGNPEAVSTYHGMLELLKAKAAASSGVDKNGNPISTFDTYGEMDKLRKYMNDNFNQKSQEDNASQPWQPGQPKSEGQSVANPSAAQAMFSKGQVSPVTGQATGINATPRAMKLEGAQKDAAQRVISESLKNKTHTVAELKNYAAQKGLDPNQFQYK